MFALPFYSISNSTERQSASPAFQGSAFAPARLRRSGYATLPIGRTTQENPSVDFLGYCRSQRLLHVAKPRIHALVTLWQETITFPEPAQEKPLRGFFLGLQNRCAILHVANPPSMACYFSARKNCLTFILMQCNRKSPFGYTARTCYRCMPSATHKIDFLSGLHKKNM